MPLHVSILAQATGPDPEPTTGAILVGVTILLTLVASLNTFSVWAVRRRNGAPAMAEAARRPLHVPVPLLWCAIVLASMMSYSASTTTPSPADVAEHESSPETPGGQEGEPVDQPDAGFRALLWTNVALNLFVLSVFGGALWVANQLRSRQLLPLNQNTTSPGQITFDSNRDLETVDSTETMADATTNPFSASTPQNSNSLEQDGDRQSYEEWNWVRETRFALEAFLIAYLPTMLLRIALVSGASEPRSHPFLESIANGVDLETMGLIFGMAVVLAPLMEELVFRVTLFGGLLERRMFWPGLLVSSALFSMSHGFPDSVALLPLALTLGYVYARRKSYRTVILVHCFFNAFNMILAFLGLL